jgi:hypothetical protein
MPDSRKYTVNFRDAEFTRASRTWADEREQCVEFASKDGHVALRDSKNPSGALLVFTDGEWAAFADGVANGEFKVQY